MIPNPWPGMLINFDGSDGSGKTYFYEKAIKWLRERTKGVVATVKEPGADREWGKRIYDDLNLDKPGNFHETDPEGFQKWYAIDSKENYIENIIPRLKKGHTVITDRSRLSGICYGFNRTWSEDEREIRERLTRLVQINESILQEHFIWPDLCLVFDASPNLCIERLKSKGKKLDGHEKLGKILSVRANYHSFIKLFPGSRTVLIDNNGRSEEEVFADVIENIRELIMWKTAGNIEA